MLKVFLHEGILNVEKQSLVVLIHVTIIGINLFADRNTRCLKSWSSLILVRFALCAKTASHSRNPRPLPVSLQFLVLVP